MTPKETVATYWQAMGGNDFAKAAEWLSEDCEIYWPQSKEVIRGRDDFAAVNAAYPAQGLWRFDVRRLVGAGDQVVSDVDITDGAVTVKAVTFHTLRGGLICRQVEYWPDDYPAPEWRAAWVTSGVLPE